MKTKKILLELSKYGQEWAKTIWHPEKTKSLLSSLVLVFDTNGRSSHQRCSVKKGGLRNFAKFTGKELCHNLFFNKVAGLRPATLLKKRLWHRCFRVNCEILKNTFFTEHLRATASNICNGIFYVKSTWQLLT